MSFLRNWKAGLIVLASLVAASWLFGGELAGRLARWFVLLVFVSWLLGLLYRLLRRRQATTVDSEDLPKEP